jgi:hypothetical protein
LGAAGTNAGDIHPIEVRELMLIRVGCNIAFEFPEPTAVIVMLNLHPSRAPTLRQYEQL